MSRESDFVSLTLPLELVYTRSMIAARNRLDEAAQSHQTRRAAASSTKRH